MKRFVRVLLSMAAVAAPVVAAHAATITVAPGEVVVNAGNGLCSLREAIANAETDTDTSGGDCVAGSGTDTISLASGSTYTLPDAAISDPDYFDSGLPAINSAIVIAGNAAIIERDPSLFPGFGCTPPAFRIAYVGPTGDLTIDNATLQHGCGWSGGALFNRGTLALTASTVRNNRANASAGAIQNDGTLSIVRSTIDGNDTYGGAGGAIVNTGTLNVVQSTISGNQTAGAGGGIDNTKGAAQVANSTLSGNASRGNGGGLFNVGTAVTFTNATVADNHGTSIAAGPTPGSGLYSYSTVTLANTLLALQLGGSNCAGVSSGTTSLADDASCPGTTVTATPMIGALAANGGPTLTHALLAGSPALDTADNTTCAAAPVNGVDQRGITRPQFGATANNCDVGAYEAVTATLSFAGNVSAAEGTGGTTTFTFTISRGSATSGIATVQVDTADGTASAGSDYTAIVGQTVTIPDGASSATVSVTVNADAVAEPDETFTVNLSNPTNAAITGGSATGTIVNDDVPGAIVSPTSGLATTEAGGTATFTVVLGSQPAADVTIGVTSSDATEGTAAPASLTFTSANWNVAQTVTVTGVDDILADGNQAYTIVTSAATSADASYNGLAVADVGVTNVDDETSASDGDGDGVPDAIENAGPNGGDGNGDAIPDATQPDVTTLPRAGGGGYLTVVSTCELRSVAAVSPTTLPPSGEVFPFGLVGFRLPCSAADMTVLYHGAASWDPGIGYWKYGPRTPGDVGTTAWYQLPGVTFDTTTVGAATVARARFALADGTLGDDTAVDGEIVDQGGPGGSPTPVPTLSQWVLGLLALLLLGAGMRRARARTSG